MPKLDLGDKHLAGSLYNVFLYRKGSGYRGGKSRELLEQTQAKLAAPLVAILPMASYADDHRRRSRTSSPLRLTQSPIIFFTGMIAWTRPMRASRIG